MFPTPTIPKTKVWEIVVEENENGEFSILMPDEMKLMRHWKVGMKTYWIDHDNGNWSIYVDNADGDKNASELSTD